MTDDRERLLDRADEYAKERGTVACSEGQIEMPLDGWKDAVEDIDEGRRTVIDLLEGRHATGPWISVTERLPDHHEKVLVWNNEYPRLAYYSEPDEFRPSGWVSDGEGFDLTDVTHWAEPLPPR